MSLASLLGDYTLQNVVLGAAMLGLVSGVLGSFAVLRKQSLLGDTLSHAALPGVCLGFIIAGGREMGSILAGALFTGSLAALVMLLLTRMSRLKTDAALGISLSVFFAIGVVLLTYIQGTGNASQGGLDAFLFGQAAATLRSDLWIMAAVGGVALALVAGLWKEFKLVSFDAQFAATQGMPVSLLDGLMTIMIALAVVIGLQMVGVVLMAAMVIAPAVAARQWANRLESMVALSALFGILGGVVGAVISATGPGLATGPLIILSLSSVVLVSLLFAPRRGFLWEILKLRRDRRQLRYQRVLTTLYQLASHHADRHYRSEKRMLDTYLGADSRRALARLMARGLIIEQDPPPHEPGNNKRWVLTPAGCQEAERILATLGQEQAH
ncbi:metal ABC transporter permease [Halomonas denitrificans]|uniref:metal ABC transporter permease n=1 Tax=Halomonas TaxID=2745 RepID=UPI001A8F7101|nr:MULTISPECIES: metal ABC transporter permease [Halomonas]MBN8412983.1 metal ABC transporter permease [Halomonas litopenaei]MBY5929117.1 metal ABC transporter permease [Halomonas sp. DP8Y7-3]MBY5983699.1 metal ABC transporter permease [Halomonas sp. DP5Y7-2]MBY6206523.1 metal ABC transporter permease [Halomonas sp. DP3Y7-2]MBY6227586.1 metal ABC transporter permease [Halomonas sp. DP3Y7-1]